MASYVEENLRPGEQVLVTAKKNLIQFVTSIIYAIIALLVCTLIWKLVGFLLGIIVAAVIVAVAYVKLKSMELAITNKKVIGKVGVINTKSIDAYLNKIDNISVSQDFWGKLLGYSTIQVNTTSAILRFPGITNTDQVKGTAMDQIEKYNEDQARYQAQCIADALAAKMR